MGTHEIWIGTFPDAGMGTPAGHGEGIWRARLAEGRLTGLRQVVQTPAPTFIAAHPSGRWLYAVGEDAAGTVTAFEVTDDGGLLARGTISSGGASPCHLALAPDARTLYVANYSSGTLGVIALDDDGALAGGASGPAQVFAHEGTGPDPTRQEGPHAHFVAAREDEVLVVDLGVDAVRRYTVAADGTLAAAGHVAELPPGTGPRHLALSPDGRRCYVVGELDVTFHVLERTGERFEPLGSISLAGERAERREHGWFLPDGGRLLASHVELRGERLLVGVREDDRLEELRVAPDGALEHVATHPLGGWPRHFATVGEHVVVAGQSSHEVEVLAPDGSRTVTALRQPACIVEVI